MEERTTKQQRVEQTAKAILDARTRYPDKSLAQLYDPDTMPDDLRRAHEENDKAVMELYGFSPDMTEEEIVAALMEKHQAYAKERPEAKRSHCVVFGAEEATKVVGAFQVIKGPGKYAVSIFDLKNGGEYGFGAEVRPDDLGDVDTTLYFERIESLESVITALEALRDMWRKEGV